MFEIFPWNPQLETGIAKIDAQHRVLIGLLNRLAQAHSQGATPADVNAVLGELANYADYHFRTEESIWHGALADDPWVDDHVRTHQKFFAHIASLQASAQDSQTLLEDLFGYLTSWLIDHILGDDKRLALAVLALREGLAPEAAHKRALAQMSTVSTVLVRTVMAMYRGASRQALSLLQEKHARQQAEEALQQSQAHWRFLVQDEGTHPATGSALEYTLRSIIDCVPAGLVVADAVDQPFVFANHWFCDMLGYSLNELQHLTPLDIHPPEALPQVHADFTTMQSGQRNKSLKMAVRRKDGSEFVANIERVPVPLGGHDSVLAIFTDITDSYHAAKALSLSESQLHTLLDAIPDLIWLKDVNGVYLSCNPAFGRFLGVPQAGIVGQTDHDFVPKALADDFRQHDRAAMAASGPLINEEWVTLAATGARALMETTKVALHNADGALLGVLGISHDITERHAVVQALQAERLRLQNAIDAARAGTWEWDMASDVISFSERTAIMLGYTDLPLRQGPYALYMSWIHVDDKPRQEEMLARHLRGDLPNFELELRLRHRDGHWVWCRTLGRVTQRSASGEPLRVAGISIDISEQKTYQAQLDFVTHHDALTGLPNRKMFVELLAHAMAQNPAGQHLAVAYMDLDGLAALNQQYGESVGNQVVLETSRRLSTATQAGQHLAHIGGDEFAVVLPGLTQTNDYAGPVERLRGIVARPLRLAQIELVVTASTGIALYPQHESVDPEQLLRQADQAMYLAKQAGRNRHYLFDAVKDEDMRERLEHLNAIRLGLQRQEFVLYYQPKVQLGSGKVVGFEALIRWQHTQRGLLAPAAFIPLLEGNPLAILVGDWVIETALAQLAQWNAHGLTTQVSVNIDAQQLLDPRFAQRLQQQLRQQPSVSNLQIQLEILETSALGNVAQVSALVKQLQGMNVEFALDDFGTGYSSLTFLKQLAARTIKIDQSFVRGMLDDPEHAAIVYSVLALARSFDRRALAEGVETEAHGRALIEFGCEYGQGYAIARPMPAAQVPAWLAQWHTPQSWADSSAAPPRDMAVLLAKVEQRAWIKQFKAYLAQPTLVMPDNDPDTCRFGKWLSRRSTRKRFEHLPGFADLKSMHDTLHQQAALLLAQTPAVRSADTDTLVLIDALSQAMLEQLHTLRLAEPDTGWGTSDLGRL